MDKSVEERATYVALTSVFLGLFSAVAFKRRRAGNLSDLKARDMALLGFATYRLARLVSFDKVLEPYREPFTQVVPDHFGAGMTVEPRGEGARRAVGELLCCPICTGTWAAAALVYALQLFPGPGRLFMSVLGAIGMGEFLHTLTEALHWNAWAARKQVGKSD